MMHFNQEIHLTVIIDDRTILGLNSKRYHYNNAFLDRKSDNGICRLPIGKKCRSVPSLPFDWPKILKHHLHWSISGADNASLFRLVIRNI